MPNLMKASKVGAIAQTLRDRPDTLRSRISESDAVRKTEPRAGTLPRATGCCLDPKAGTRASRTMSPRFLRRRWWASIWRQDDQGWGASSPESTSASGVLGVLTLSRRSGRSGGGGPAGTGTGGVRKTVTSLPVDPSSSCACSKSPSLFKMARGCHPRSTKGFFGLSASSSSVACRSQSVDSSAALTS